MRPEFWESSAAAQLSVFLSQILLELFPFFHIVILPFREQMDNKMHTRRFELYSYRRKKSKC